MSNFAPLVTGKYERAYANLLSRLLGFDDANKSEVIFYRESDPNSSRKRRLKRDIEQTPAMAWIAQELSPREVRKGDVAALLVVLFCTAERLNFRRRQALQNLFNKALSDSSSLLMDGQSLDAETALVLIERFIAPREGASDAGVDFEARKMAITWAAEVRRKENAGKCTRRIHRQY